MEAGATGLGRQRSALGAAIWLCIAFHVEIAGGQDTVGWRKDAALPYRDSDEYLSMIRTDYKWRIQDNYVQYSIDMLLEPCRDETETGGKGDSCCYDTNVQGCQQNYTTIEAVSDLQVAYFQNAHIPTCYGTEFASDPNCGTYIEVHRFNSKVVLADVSIANPDVGADSFINGYRTVRVPTHRLCMGWYELWWVVRTRSGPYVQKTRSFYVSRPSCAAPDGYAATPESTLPPAEIP